MNPPLTSQSPSITSVWQHETGVPHWEPIADTYVSSLVVFLWLCGQFLITFLWSCKKDLCIETHQLWITGHHELERINLVVVLFWGVAIFYIFGRLQQQLQHVNQNGISSCCGFGPSSSGRLVVPLCGWCGGLRPMSELLLQVVAPQGSVRDPHLSALWEPVPLCLAVQPPTTLAKVLCLHVQPARREKAPSKLDVWATGNKWLKGKVKYFKTWC